MTETRREFLRSCAFSTLGGAAAAGLAPTSSGAQADARSWRQSFPALDPSGAERSLSYLDSAATTLRPREVIDAVAEFDRRDNANPSPTLHSLARRAQERFAAARSTVAQFVNARDPAEIVWTRGTTEGVNLVATSWGGAHLRSGDEVLLTIAEHYSNLLPWRLAAERAGATVRYVEVEESGELRLSDFDRLLSSRTKIVAVSHVSNVLGVVNPIRSICDRAHRAGALVFVDGAQSAPHVPIDVRELDCDFFAFSSHKMLGPMGVGVLWARREILDAMPPYHVGSNMVHDVELDGPLHWSEAGYKFQAGTPNVSGPVGLAAAIDLYARIGREALGAHERTLVKHALERLREVPGLRLLGVPKESLKLPVFTFTVKGVEVPRIVAALDARGVAVRGGDLAARPLLRRFGIDAAVRASCFLYTAPEDIDRLAEGLELVKPF